MTIYKPINTQMNTNDKFILDGWVEKNKKII